MDTVPADVPDADVPDEDRAAVRVVNGRLRRWLVSCGPRMARSLGRSVLGGVGCAEAAPGEVPEAGAEAGAASAMAPTASRIVISALREPNLVLIAVARPGRTQ